MKSPHQTIAPYLILQYLLKKTDEKTNVIRRADISSYLSEDCGVQLAEHAVGNAISELNIALHLIEENETADDAAAYLDENPDEAHILYDKKRQGFFVNRRPHDIGADDIRLIVESVYSAKFIEESETRHLVDELCALVSDNQAAAIKHECYPVFLPYI